MDKTENTRSPPFSYYMDMAADVNTGIQSINTERASKMVSSSWIGFQKK